MKHRKTDPRIVYDYNQHMFNIILIMTFQNSLEAFCLSTNPGSFSRVPWKSAVSDFRSEGVLISEITCCHLSWNGNLYTLCSP